MERPIPNYELPRRLTEAEELKRRVAWRKLLDFVKGEGVSEFEVMEQMAIGYGLFYCRTPSLDWSVEGRCFAVGFEYDEGEYK